MQIDPTHLQPRDFYRYMTGLITPRPIAWVSTINTSGLSNLAPFSFFNAVGSNPPMLMFCPALRRDGTKKDTLVNIEATREFVVNIVSFDLGEKMNSSSAEVDAETSEFEKFEIEEAPSKCVTPPRVKAARAAFECVVHDVLYLGHGPGGSNMVIGKIVSLYLSETVLNDRGDVDPAAIDTIGRLSGDGYARTTERFTLNRP